MSSHEFMSDAELSSFEARADAEAERINESLTTPEPGAVCEFCPDCPFVKGHTPDEVKQASELVGWSLSAGRSFNGAIVTMQLGFEDGTQSKSMILSAFPGRVFTGKMVGAAYADAVKKTQACEKPRSFPKFMGPFAVKSCGALEQYKRDW